MYDYSKLLLTFLIDHSVQYQPLNEEPGDQIAAEPLGYQ